jgi:hypothetical protein
MGKKNPATLHHRARQRAAYTHTHTYTHAGTQAYIEWDSITKPESLKGLNPWLI